MASRSEIGKLIGQAGVTGVLDLTSLKLHKIPEEVFELTQLETLHLHGNEISEIPKEIGKLTQLRDLDISRNEIKEIPIEIGALIRLKDLDLSGNQIREIPKEIGLLTRLETLYLNENQINEIPKEIGALKRLEILHLYENQISQIPKAISKLVQLNDLNLSLNNIRELSEEITQISQLKSLHLSSNQIQEISTKISNLIQLEVLSLSDNYIRQIPKKLTSLIYLKNLYLNENNIDKIPKEIGKLTQIVELDLANNKIEEIPVEMNALTQLEWLDLSNNQIMRVNLAFHSELSLNIIYLHGNPSLKLTPELLGPTFSEVLNGQSPASPRAILEYLAKVQQGSRPLNEAKLIFVGRGEAGKSSLVKRLVHNTFDEHEAKTEGIQITDLTVNPQPNENTLLHIWDFGGQEILHATHRLFLTSRCVYVLVLDHRANTEHQDAAYWLDTISNFSRDARVILVLNKISSGVHNINTPPLLERYPMIKAVLRTDCAGDGIGIQELRAEIERQVDQLENLRKPFPESWFAIKDGFSKRTYTGNYIRFEDYQKLCAQAGETDLEAQKALAEFLHNLGIIVNFAENARLADNYILDPHWLTAGIYKIIHNIQIQAAGGWLHLTDLKSILPATDYPEHFHPYLIDLMRHFELCFGSENDRVLIPELLSEIEPDGIRALLLEPAMRLNYKYTTLPEGLIPRFIVRSRAMHDDDLRWRTGVVLQRGECRAVIVRGEDKNRNQVHISVIGPDQHARRDLLASIRYDLDSIHNDYRDLKPSESVPLPELEANEEVVTLQRLKKEEARGNKTYEHYSEALDKHFEFDVQELLYGPDYRSLIPNFRKRGDSKGIKERLENPRIKVFLSYSHEDHELKEKLETHLKTLAHRDLIDHDHPWNDRRIMPGEEWYPKIIEELERAEIILLLISSDFIASNFCYKIELPVVMKRHETNNAIVIPILLRDCVHTGHPFSKLQGLPNTTKGKFEPVTSWGNQDAALTNVTQGLLKSINEIRKQRGLPPV
jgi:internalin A